MTCENPRREYVATFDDGQFIVTGEEGETAYKVLAVELTADHLIVAGMVGQDSGLGFAAQFSPTPKIEFYSDDEVFQTDVCRLAVSQLQPGFDLSVPDPWPTTLKRN